MREVRHCFQCPHTEIIINIRSKIGIVSTVCVYSKALFFLEIQISETVKEYYYLDFEDIILYSMKRRY